MSDNCDVVPDDTLLKQIFRDVQPETISILLHNWQKCVFKTEKPQYIVRLEVESGESDTFDTIAAIQQLAAAVVADFVPQTFQVGKAKNAQGKTFHFSVTQLIEGVVLDEVWQDISVDDQKNIVRDLVEALKKLHTVRLSDVKNLCSKEYIGAWKDLDKPKLFGGPHTGFLDDGPALLESIIDRRKTKKHSCVMTVDSHGITVKSSFEALGSKSVGGLEYSEWAKEAVLCHNDLTPRNLILRRTSPAGQYRLTGIIDWEMAGFYPASYELGLQDTYLSGGNRQISFYLSLKEHMATIIQRSASQVRLLEAMELIFETQQRAFLEGTNIPAHIRARFLQSAHLIRDTDPYLGWKRDPTHDTFEYSRAAAQQLEDRVVEERIERRKSKAVLKT